MDLRPDHEVVRAVVDGDTESFATLIHRYGDSCTRFAIRMLGSRADADDALQSAFIRAFRGLPRCRDPRRFRSWLMQIVANECRSYGSRQTRRARRFVQDESALENAEAPPTDSSDLRDELHRALAMLPPAQREAFVLRYAEDMSYEEMAAVTGAGISALKMRAKRACERMRELLDGVLL
jgi:RNA polymerase sigma-70 factor (ECF subfamily)